MTSHYTHIHTRWQTVSENDVVVGLQATAPCNFAKFSPSYIRVRACSSVGMRRRTDTDTQTDTRTLLTNIHFAVVYDSRKM